MARRMVDISMLEGLVEGSQNQEISKGVRKSIDPKFPVFSTPVGQDILVYIPMVNVVQTENGTDMRVLSSHIHDYTMGRAYGQMRCINGLAGSGVFDALGYDGTCPACEAMQDVWALYNKKLKAEADKLGIDPQNDPNDSLKSIRERLLREMDIKNPDEYVTFPIVIIPTKGKMTPADDALENLQPVYVTWRKKRYVDKILSQLDTLMTNPGHPAGMFWFWKFTYDTQGKQANARDAAKNAKYNIIQDASALEMLGKFKEACEKAAAEFTLIKAAQVIVANQFMYKEDMETEVNKIMAKTRQFLAMSDITGGAPQIGVPTVAPQLTGASQLANFGLDTSTQPIEQNGAVGGNPVKFEV